MIRALNTIALVVAVVLAFALYKAKTEAHAARERVEALAAAVEEERRQVAVLRAEMAYLERPERLRALAQRFLGLEPMGADQEVTLEQLLLALGTLEDQPGAEIPEPAPGAGVALRGSQPREGVVFTGGREQ